MDRNDGGPSRGLVHAEDAAAASMVLAAACRRLHEISCVMALVPRRPMRSPPRKGDCAVAQLTGTRPDIDAMYGCRFIPEKRYP